MKILAFDTSTEVMSIAVQRGEDIFAFTGAGGAQASSRLIPEIQILMQQANLTFKELNAIAFGAGPGAFTGLRASCAVAQGLGFGAGVLLCPINTLHAAALLKHQATGYPRITAALDARMDEVYWQRFDFSSHANGEPIDAQPQLSPANTQVEGAHLAFDALPTARILLRLAQAMLANGLAVRPVDALPLYVRHKVAQTTAEREMTKAAKTAAEQAP